MTAITAIKPARPAIKPWWIDSARIPHVSAANDRGLTHQVPLLALAATPGLGTNQFRAQWQNAALLRQRGLPAREWPPLYVGDFQHRGSADQFLGARRIVHTGQL